MAGFRADNVILADRICTPGESLFTEVILLL